MTFPELSPLPEPKLYPPGTYPDGVLTYSADQMQAYALAYGSAIKEWAASQADWIVKAEYTPDINMSPERATDMEFSMRSVAASIAAAIREGKQ